MDNQQFQPVQSQSILTIILPTIIVTALIVGGGIWWWQKSAFEKEKEELQQQIEELESQVSEIINTSDWKTYTNEEYGVEMKYPDSFIQKEDNATSKLFSGTDGHFWIFIESNTNGLDAEGLKDDYYKNDEYGYQYQDSFPIINQVESYKQGCYDLGVIEKFYIPKNDKVYKVEFEFNFTVPNQILKEERINLINQIISTFKFDENFTPDWFNNSENKFRGEIEGHGFPIYTNNRLCFQITLPDYAENYEAVVDEKATNLINFRKKGTEPNQYGYYGRWFSIGRMSNEEYKYFSEIDSRGTFADSKVIGKSDKYVYLLNDIFVSQPPKTDKITAEELKFKIIDCN